MSLGLAYDDAVGDGDFEIDNQSAVKPQMYILYCILGYQILSVCSEETSWIKLFCHFIERLREFEYPFLIIYRLYGTVIYVETQNVLYRKRISLSPLSGIRK